MSQAADVRPEPTFQRKAAIVTGGATDHAGRVSVAPIPDFDLDRTIFQTLEGAAARYVMKKRVGKEVVWETKAASEVQSAYDEAQGAVTLPDIAPELLEFMVNECNFDVEHADGSFLDHLYFCFEYGVHHYPQHSPLVLLLHSILGTGTNTFAMTADKIPQLKALLTDFEWRQTEAFPSVLRLLYAGTLRNELRENLHRLDQLSGISFHRVIDNESIELSAEDFWIALNYQLIHLVDFLPVANWSTHQNDTSFIIFRDLVDLMHRGGKVEASIHYQPEDSSSSPVGETFGFGGWLTTRIPVTLAERLAAKSVTRFSERIGHSLEYTLHWQG